MKKRLVYLVLPIITLILEIIPYGAVLNFKRPDENGVASDFILLYSYFDTMPFGWGNIAPMITGILTCFCLLFVVIYCIKGKKRSLTVVRNLFFVTAGVNLLPLLYGFKFLTVVMILISVTLVVEAWFLMKENMKSQGKK